MRVLIFSDIHGDRRSLERLIDTEADCYVAAGDLATWARGLDQLGPTLSRRAGAVYVMPGNHESASDIERFCAQWGFNNFHGAHFQGGQYQVAGLGYSSPTPFNTPGEYSEPELQRRLSAFETLNPLVMICHSPPFGTPLDRIRDGLHAGSTAVKAFIDKVQPRYFFCGHIHEAEGVQVQLGVTTAVNVGKKGYLLEL